MNNKLFIFISVCVLTTITSANEQFPSLTTTISSSESSYIKPALTSAAVTFSALKCAANPLQNRLINYLEVDKKALPGVGIQAIKYALLCAVAYKTYRYADLYCNSVAYAKDAIQALQQQVQEYLKVRVMQTRSADNTQMDLIAQSYYEIIQASFEQCKQWNFELCDQEMLDMIEALGHDVEQIKEAPAGQLDCLADFKNQQKGYDQSLQFDKHLMERAQQQFERASQRCQQAVYYFNLWNLAQGGYHYAKWRVKSWWQAE